MSFAVAQAHAASAGIGGIVAFQASQAARIAASRSGWRLARLARSRSSLGDVEQVFVPSTRRYFQSPSRIARWPRWFMRQYSGRSKRCAGIAQLPAAATRRPAGSRDRQPTPAASSIVADQSIVMQCCSLTPPGGDRGRPVRDPGHADAAFGQVHLAADQRPVVGEALAAVVAGEDHQRVVRQAAASQRVQHPADAFVHVVDHAAVGVDVAAVQVEQVVLAPRAPARASSRVSQGQCGAV